MKLSKILSILLVIAMLAAMLVACNNDPDEPETDDLAGTYNITMWVSEKEGVAELFKKQIDAFEAANPGIIINAQIEGVTEADAGSKVVNDVATAPDIYCFAQDQLARLVQAAALVSPGKTAQETIKNANDAGSVAAASVAGTIYAYPMTSDNGYYMYYDKSLISEEDAEDLAKIIAACENAGKKFRYNLEDSWYTASFFFGAGCHSTWTMDANGNFNGVDDDFNSDKGLAAMKGMQLLAKSSCHDNDANVFTDAAVVITGTWNAEAAEEYFGANLAATDLPSYTIDGQTYHLGSFTGYKLMGVKPQTDVKKTAVLSKLAEFLTNEDCQNERFAEFQWGPSNKNAQASEAVQANVSLAALAKQSAYGVPQGQVHGAYWDNAKVLGAQAKVATTDAELKAALETYEKAIKAVVSMTDEQKQAWGVIGGICGTAWDTDLPMTKTSDTTWESEVLELNAGEEFKVRQGADWAVQCGAEGMGSNPSNIVVETTGKYIVKLTWDGAETASVELVPAQ